METFNFEGDPDYSSNANRRLHPLPRAQATRSGYSDSEKAAYYKKKFRTAKKKKRTYRKKNNYRRGGGTSIIYPNVVSGLGSYTMNPSDSYGKRYGGYLGSLAGEYLGGLAQSAFGLGDYVVKSNTLLAPEPPTIINDSVKGGITFRHKEYLRDIVTSSTPGAFNLDSYLLNPGNPKTFPWLSQVAQNFEQYSLEGVLFEFRSMSADALNSTNTALGTVIMATNYDSIDAPFKSKGEMENYEWGMSSKPSCNMIHPIECAPRQTSITELYILDGPVPSGADPRLYHWGNMQIATNGFQGTSVNIGELWVSYQIRLLKPKIYSAVGLEIGTYVSLNSSYTNALPLGNGTLDILYDTIGMIWDPPNRNIGFPVLGLRKHYEVIIRWTGSLTVGITYPSLLFSNCTSTNTINANGPAPGETATSCVSVFSVMVEANTFGVVQLGNAGVLPSSGNQVRVLVTEINPFNK